MLITFLSILGISYYYKIRNSLIFTLCVWGCLVFFSTEIFSLFHAINQSYIISFWTISALLSTSYCLWLYRKKKIQISHTLTKYDIFNVCFILWLLLLGTTAFVMVPNNYDSMTYHLARVMNWIQNGSVSYYPTNINRQIYSPVWAEYVILHTFLLTGTDLWANMIQFFAYLLSSVILWMIATKLNFHKAVKYFMLVLFMMLPMAVAQSMTTQTDLVATLWLLAFVYIAIDLVQMKQLVFNKDSFTVIFEGAAICALAFLSKSSVCSGICIFLLWIAFRYIRFKHKFLPLCLFGLMAVLIVGIMVIPTFYRNHHHAGDIFATDYTGKIVIGTYHPEYVFVNLAKNYAMLATNHISHEFLSKNVTKLSKLLNVDVNHPDISYTDNFTNEIGVIGHSFHHDLVSCSYVSILWFFCCIIWGITVCLRKNIKNRLFVFSCICAILIGMMTLRYQIWGCRILLPYCALMLIVIGWTMNLFSKQKITYIVLFCFSLGAIPGAIRTFKDQLKYFPSHQRIEKYFVNNPDLYTTYSDLVQYVNVVNTNKNIGIFLGEDTWEYPFWKMMPKKHIIQITPDGTGENVPVYIFAINKDMEPSSSLVFAGKEFKPVYFYKGNKQYAVLASDEAKNINIDFTAEGNIQNLQTEGLSTAEKTHSWSNASQVIIKLNGTHLNSFKKDSPLLLSVSAWPFLGKNNLKEQRVKVYANDALIAVWKMKQEGEFIASLPQSIINEKEVVLRFEISNPMSPKELGLSEDARSLGIAFKKISIKPKGA